MVGPGEKEGGRMVIPGRGTACAKPHVNLQRIQGIWRSSWRESRPER